MLGENKEMQIAWFKGGDVDATIGVFFDGFTKILVGVSILSGVMAMPNDIIFGKIVSSIGFTAFLLLAFNTFYARYLGRKLGNPEITAMPAGVSGGTFFVWLFAIMMPTYFASGDALYAWKVAVNVNILYSVIIIAFAFIIKFIMKHVPNQAMLGGVVGGSMAYLLIGAMGDGFAHPLVILVTLFVLLFFNFGKIKPKFFSPAFIAVGLGTIVAWVTGVMKPETFMASFATTGLYIPLPQIGLLGGEAFQGALTFLPLILAFAFSDVTALLQGLEQAVQSGEKFDQKTSLLATGLCNLIGTLFGNPFPVNMYWGHPAWKKAKAGASYPLFTGAIYLILCVTGLVAIATSAIPSSATLVLLVFVAIMTGAQAFEVVEKKYYPAMIVATAIPIFELIYGKVSNGISAASNAIGDALTSGGIDFDVSSVAVNSSYLAKAGVANGYFDMSKGSMLIAIIFACVIIFMIDRKWINVSVAFLVAGACSFVGLIHGANVEFNAAPVYTGTYLAFAVAFIIIKILSKNMPGLQPEEEIRSVQEQVS